MTTRLRVGAVTYLNTKPLVFRLEQFAPQTEISFDLPSRLADDLAAGRLDVALIPSIEYFQDPTYTIVSDACIACHGSVLSVKLFCRVPVRQIRRLALDEGSRTSAALSRILLKERFGLEPRLVPLPIGTPLEEIQADAVLMIGDRAMHSPSASFAEVWDLGDQWCRWTNLPFVFAMWVARGGVNVSELAGALTEARDCGVASLEQIADKEAAGLGLTVPECLGYLRDHLHFYLGPTEREGLKLFYRKAGALGLAPQDFQFTSAVA